MMIEQVEKPLTPALSPQERGEGAETAPRRGQKN